MLALPCPALLLISNRFRDLSTSTVLRVSQMPFYALRQGGTLGHWVLRVPIAVHLYRSKRSDSALELFANAISREHLKQFFGFS